jgi:hypothetical protein
MTAIFPSSIKIFFHEVDELNRKMTTSQIECNAEAGYPTVFEASGHVSENVEALQDIVGKEHGTCSHFDDGDDVEKDSSKTDDVIKDNDERGIWEMKKVLSDLDLNSKRRPRRCSSDSCTLLAAVVYSNANNPKQIRNLCLDCQVSFFRFFQYNTTELMYI